MTQRSRLSIHDDRMAVLIAGLLMAVYFVAISQSRLVARDEGYFMMAAKLTSLGGSPYRDYFYPQMPLLPYVYGLWMHFTETTWAMGRLLSGLFAAGTGTLLFGYCKTTIGLWGAIAAATLFCTSNFVFPWYTTVQVYGLAVLLAFAAFYCVDRWRSPLVGGALFGLCVSSRLTMLPLGAAFAIPLWRTGGAKSLFRFAVGLLLGLIPAILLGASSPEAFFFDNLGYHLERPDVTKNPYRQHRTIVRTLLGFRDTDKYDAWQFPLLTYSAIASLAICVWRRRLPSTALAATTILFVSHLAPRVPYVQHFAVLVPFAIVAAIELVSDIPRTPSKAKRGAAALVVLSCLVTWVWGFGSDLDRYTRSGRGVIGIIHPEVAPSWTLASVSGIGKLVDIHAGPGETVLADWPGYLVESSARPLPGTENHFGLQLARWKVVPDEKLSRIQVASIAEIREALRKKEPSLVIHYSARNRMAPLEPMTRASGYRNIETVAGLVRFYTPAAE